MIRTLVGSALPASTVEALVARSDGVLLYVEELTRSVVEAGTTGRIEEIPATLTDSLMGRLESNGAVSVQSIDGDVAERRGE